MGLDEPFRVSGQKVTCCNMTVPRGGELSLVLDRNASGLTVDGPIPIEYRLEFVNNTSFVPYPGTSIDLDSVVAGQLSDSDNTSEFVFELTDNTPIWIDNRSNDPTIVGSLSGPYGLIFDSQPLTVNNVPQLFYDNLRLAPGQYQLALTRLQSGVPTEFNFNVKTLDAGQPIALGSDTSGTLMPFATDIYRLNSVVAGTVFDFLTPSSISAKWTLLDPDGQIVFATGQLNLNDVSLQKDGAYSLLVENLVGTEALAPYSFTVTEVIAQPPRQLTLGIPLTTAIDAQNRAPTFAFTLNEVTSLLFNGTASNPLVTWSLSGPRGEVSKFGTFTSDRTGVSDATFESLQDLPAGDYIFTVQNPLLVSDHINFELSAFGLGLPVQLGTPIAIESLPQDTNVFRFDGVANEKYFFDVIASENTTNTFWRLVDPYGRVVFHEAVKDRAVFEFDSSGQYRLLVETYAASDASAASLEFQVRLLPFEDPIPLTVGMTVADTLDIPGISKTYSFRVDDDSAPANRCHW